MASLATIPNEVTLYITGYLDDWYDVAAFARVCRATQPIADNELYRRVAKTHGYLVCWASEFGRVETVKKLLAAGASVQKHHRARRPWVGLYLRGHPLTWNLDGYRHSPFQMLYGLYGHRRRHASYPWNMRLPDTQQERKEERGTDMFETDSDASDGDTTVDGTERGTKTPGSQRHSDDATDGGATVTERGTEMFENDSDATDGDATVDGTEPVPFKPWGWIVNDPIYPPLYLDKTQTTRAERGGEAPPPNGISYWFPLHLAAMGGHVEIAELLLSHGAGLDKTAVGVCRCMRATLDCEDRKSAAGARWAAAQADQTFLAQDIPVTPLHLALCHRQQEMAIMLLQRGASPVFDKPRWKAHAIHTAAEHGCLDVVKLLLRGDKATNINIQDSRGLTPLYYAYSTRQRETMLWLLENKADVDAELGAGLTLLHLACLDGAFAIACRLVDAGADVNRLWAESIVNYVGPLRPLELCCALHYTKSRRVYAAGNALLHERRFERRRLELMKKLLEAGASTTPMCRDLVYQKMEISAVSIAASHHSIPMLQLLAASGADMTQELSAIHQTIYPAFMEWGEPRNCRNPLPTLRWLVAHNAPLGPTTPQVANATIFVCEQPLTCPWKREVLEWLLSHHAHPDMEALVCCRYSVRRTHPMHMIDGFMRAKSMTPLVQALRIDDTSTCTILLRAHPRPDLTRAFELLLHEAYCWNNHSWSSESWEDGRCLELENTVGILLGEDDEETIKGWPDTFLCLMSATSLAPSDMLLDAALPTEAAIRKRHNSSYPRDTSVVEKARAFYGLRDQLTSTQAQEDWDMACRLVIAILEKHWNAAHFLLQHCANTSWWAQKKGMEYFPPVLSALELAPPPGIIRPREYPRSPGALD